MLYPQSNSCRQMADLSGFWDFRFDSADEGLDQGWGAGFDPGEIIAVPASWNDQFEDWRDYIGVAWYQTALTCRGAGGTNDHAALCFASATWPESG